MTEFDPATHRMVPEQRWFEDFVIGERFVLPGRTQTTAIFAAFQAASGDTHPIHYDVEYCRKRGYAGLLAHGLQVVCFTAAGAGRFPHEVSDFSSPFSNNPAGSSPASSTATRSIPRSRSRT